MKFIFINIMIGMYRGGGENYDLNLSKKLIQEGHNVEFIFLKPIFQKINFHLPKKYIVTPVKSPWLYFWSVYISQNRFLGKLKGLRGIPRAIGQFIFEMQVFFILLKKTQDDVIIHICGLSFLGMLITVFSKKQVYTRFPGPPSYKLHYFFIRNTFAIIANGDAFKQIQNKTSKSNLIYLNVGLNFDKFKITQNKNQVKKKLSLSVKKNYIIFVGRLVPIKNLPLLIHALKHLFQEFLNWDLLIVGEGPDYQKVKSIALKSNVLSRVHFLGHQTGNNLTDYYSASDILVLPSIYDNFSNVVLEAMAMKLPVIATKSGGSVDQIKNGYNGYLIENEDLQDLKKKLKILIKNPQKRKVFGELGYKTVRERFSWEKTVKSFMYYVNQGKLNDSK